VTKAIRLMIWFGLLSGGAALASASDLEAEDLETVHLNDAAWVKNAGDRLARCAGTYRGAAAVMRQSGREQAAAYAEAVGSGALFAAYLLFTSPAALEAKVLDPVDANVHIEALAWGTKRNFIMMDTHGDPAMGDVLRSCTRTSSLQSSILRGAMAAPTAADAAH
jgi:hypothetical protein